MDNPNLISLLTDFGHSDWYVGTMKGVIHSINPHARVVDICHAVKPHHIIGGAFMLSASYRYFPEGTVHMAVVDPGVGGERKPIIVKTERYHFVAPDNGLLSFALEAEKPLKIVEITNSEFFLKPVSRTFHGRDIFAPAAAHLSRGVPVEEFGGEIGEIVRIEAPKPILLGGGKARGHVLYIDTFGNAITDVPSSMLSGYFRLIIKGGVIEKVYDSYSQAAVGEVFGIIGSYGNLEIASKEESAAATLSLKEGDEFTVEGVSR
jgi:S-adenosylmethionine hydrolase